MIKSKTTAALLAAVMTLSAAAAAMAAPAEGTETANITVATEVNGEGLVTQYDGTTAVTVAYSCEGVTPSDTVSEAKATPAPTAAPCSTETSKDEYVEEEEPVLTPVETEVPAEEAMPEATEAPAEEAESEEKGAPVEEETPEATEAPAATETPEATEAPEKTTQATEAPAEATAVPTATTVPFLAFRSQVEIGDLYDAISGLVSQIFGVVAETLGW